MIYEMGKEQRKVISFFGRCFQEKKVEVLMHLEVSWDALH